ncbi:MAG: carbohydrate kinase family protein [Anaerolineae bacterium]|nr:carbohydrate kinase family protein [Anaerolineae bacterium]
MSYGEHSLLVIGAATMDVQVWPRTETIESGCSNPGQIRWGWGGVARNIAENLARLGANVQFITAVGDDADGQRLLENLHEMGVDTEHALKIPERSTASYAAFHHLDGQLWVAFDDMKIIREITPGYLNRNRRLFSETEMVCIDANLSAATLKTVFRLAHQYDVPVCVDPTAVLLSHRLHPYFPEISVLTPGLAEAESLLGDSLSSEGDIVQGARRLVQLGVDLAIITLGADGLAYATPEESGRLPAFPVEVVDPAGAGDALTAAVAYALLEGVSPEEAVRLGMAAATQTILCEEIVCPYITFNGLYEWLVV